MQLQQIPVPSQRVKISENDATPDFLASKLAAGTGLALTVNQDGDQETLAVSAAFITTEGRITAADGVIVPRGAYIYHRQSLTADTDGDWRQYADDSGFYTQKREGGVWVTKATIF